MPVPGRVRDWGFRVCACDMCGSKSLFDRDGRRRLRRAAAVSSTGVSSPDRCVPHHPSQPVMGGASSSDRGLWRIREPAMGQGAEVWNSVPLRDRATVQGWLWNGLPFCLEEVRRPMRARILDGDKLQVAVFQPVNLIDGVGVSVAEALGFRHKDLRPLEPALK